MKRTIHNWKLRCVMLLGIGAPFYVQADITRVTVKVTVVAPPCIVNDNKVISVEFGDVMTTLVDSDNYRKPVNYTLDCKGVTSSVMKLQVKGNGAPFDNTLLNTDKDGLGIKILVGSTKLSINNWVNFTYPNKPILWATLSKKSGVFLTGGGFSASATMSVDYL